MLGEWEMGRPQLYFSVHPLMLMAVIPAKLARKHADLRTASGGLQESEADIHGGGHLPLRRRRLRLRRWGGRPGRGGPRRA